jgi:hypothetical protein
MTSSALRRPVTSDPVWVFTTATTFNEFSPWSAARSVSTGSCATLSCGLRLPL